MKLNNSGLEFFPVNLNESYKIFTLMLFKIKIAVKN